MITPKAACAAVLAALLSVTATMPAAADPPPWAPAHGYRAKHAIDPHLHHDIRHVIVLPEEGGGATCNRELIGRILGAAAGGVGGSQIGKGSGQVAAVIVGVIVGGVMGGEIGRTMDRSDLGCVGQSLERLPTGRKSVWHNPDSGMTYSLEPTRTWRRDDGRYCRAYDARAVIDGQVQDVKGTACRRPDQTWEIVG